MVRVILDVIPRMNWSYDLTPYEIELMKQMRISPHTTEHTTNSGEPTTNIIME